MKAKYHAYTFTVTGRGYFPVDMLRYDRCVARTIDDAINIQLSRFPPGIDDPRKINLIAYVPVGCTLAPTFDRWRSFGWTVDPASVKPVTA